jgi:peroxiredoxin
MNKKAIILGISILLLITGIVAFTGCERTCPSVDAKAPDFTVADINGKNITLKDFLGKPVMLVFWQTTCTWCNFQMPFVQQMAVKYASSGLNVLPINIGESVDKVKSYKQAGNYTLNFLLDKDAVTYGYYCVPAFPATVFIDKQGIIKNAKLGAFQTANEMEDYLKSLN